MKCQLVDELVSPLEIVRALGTIPQDTWATRKYPHLYAAPLEADADDGAVALPGCMWPFIIVNIGEPYALRYSNSSSRDIDCRMDSHFVHLIPPGKPGVYELSVVSDRTAHRILLAMDPAWLRQFLMDNTGQLDVGSMSFFLGRNEKRLAASVTSLYHALQEPLPLNGLFVDSAAQFIAASLLKDYCKVDDQPFSTTLPRRRLRNVLDFIHMNYTVDIQLGDLADEAGLSAFHFSRLFKEATGMSPRQYIIKLRMKEACRLLKETKHDVVDIALLVGYESVSHFSSLFKRHMGVSPASYRRV